MSFSAYLERLEARLDIPYPERRRVVDEIAAHLEALHEEALSEGLDPGAARDRAIEALAADEEFLAEMGEVHRTALARALDRLPRRVSLGLEVLGIGAVGLAMVATVLVMEVKVVDFIRDGGIFMIPINLAGLAIVLLTLERAYSLFLKRDHSKANVRKRLLSIRFLGWAAALTGVLATLLGFYVACGAAIRRGIDLPMYEVVSIALTTSILGGSYALVALTASYIFEAKARKIEALRLS